MINIKVDKNSVDIRIDKLLMQRYEAGFPLMQKLIRSKKIKINGKAISKPVKLQFGDEIEVFAKLKDRNINEKPRSSIPQRKIDEFFSYKIYEDDNILAIDKPSGLAVQGRSLARASIDDILYNLKQQGEGLFLVHRIDRDTSGVLLLAKNKKAAALLTEHFKNKTIKKTYLALLDGNLKQEQGRIDIPLKKKRVGALEKVYPDFANGDQAISDYKLLRHFDGYCLVEFSPITGRTHQLRVHAKEIGHAIIGDFKYGGKKVIRKEVASRLCLHAQSVTLQDYFGRKLEIKAKSPDFSSKF